MSRYNCKLLTHSYTLHYYTPPVKITLGFLANSLSGETPPQLPALSLDIVKVLRVSGMPGCYICTIIVIIAVVEMVSHACTCWSNLSCDLCNIWTPLVDLGISARKFHSFVYFVVPELQLFCHHNYVSCSL